MNWIKSEFAALRYFILNGIDHRSHDEQNVSIGAYIRWYNHRACSKRDFAINSRIRQPHYQINVA